MVTTDRKCELYIRRGWCPIPWSHHPQEIKNEIRRLGFRPKMKSCYENCQRFFIWTELDGVTYHEGYVTSLIPIDHAWLMWNGLIVDLTLNNIAEYGKNNTYSREDVRAALFLHRVWGPVDQRRMYEISPWYDVLKVAMEVK